ncbi:MAG: class I SAM-dependent methyltransferase [Casimicrobiaceae bacterium]
MAQGGAALGADLKQSAARLPRSSASAYGPLSTLFYDAAYPRAAEAEVAWYRTRLPRGSGPVLEAMAGSGRLLLPLTEEGFNVHGVDQSEAMLASCGARLEAVGRDARLFRQDLALLNLPSRYGAAFIAAGSFQLLTAREAATDALICLRAHLVGPAVLLLDLFVPDAAQHPPGAPVVEVSSVILPDASQIVHRAEATTDPERRRTHYTSRYERRVGGGIVAREDESVAFTWYAEDEIVALLRSASYRDVRIEPPAWPREHGRHFAVSARG